MAASPGLRASGSSEVQEAARDAVRQWAKSAAVIESVRKLESASPEARAWGSAYVGLAELGIFGVAVPEAAGGSGAGFDDMIAMVDEAAASLVPGPVATSALAAVVLASAGHGELVEALAAGERTAGLALAGDLRVAEGLVSGVLPAVLGGTADGVLLAPGPDGWLLVDCVAVGVDVNLKKANDFSRPWASVTLNDAVAHPVSLPAAVVADLAAVTLSAEAVGVARWALQTAVEYAKVREQFGKQIGSFQAIKHMCAEMLCRVEQADVAVWDAAGCAQDVLANNGDSQQLSLATAVAAAVAVDAAVVNTKDCIQILGGIGFTWEHDAHLYLRRAYTLQAFLGKPAVWRRKAAALTLVGTRRSLTIDLGEVETQRAQVAATAAEIASTPKDEHQIRLAETGYLAPHWPAPYGVGAGAAQQLLIDQELHAAGVTRPDLVIGWWAAPTILEHGTPDQIAQFVAPTLRGEIEWCQLFSEPGAGSDLAALRTKATRVDGGWKLDGQKVWNSKAQVADWAICLARTNPDVPKHKGITYFLLDMKTPGITVRPLREITGEEMFNEVFLDGVVIPDENVVGSVDDGWRLARTTLANERVAMAGGGALDEAMESLIALIGDSELDVAQLDTLGSFVCSAQSGALLDLRTALRAIGGQDPGAASSVRKLVGVRHRQGLSEHILDYIDTHGAVESHEMWLFMRDRCLSIAGGTTQILLSVAGERLLGLPR
ncbi:acyl-CoA dehydrogenase [Mycobacterium sp. CBMA271]|uniref:acyl-CoA dehydrogenase n=1 Tax=unclassified Mycobacteroides TaxID=2618759 RepID=UPI0013237226|nr:MULTISPECIES: acyl-CoA dehydrogenase [unclassified Mycobacteroides]MUM16928.1 acyl-CoA dehydrogenase [Mycobacteroides sp. CBMA 326]MUM24083.1 acyl-CoA dehydrogenase [Mycobacteroides sp. CBMA 271]